MRYSEFMKMRVAGAETGLPRQLFAKAATRTFAESIGVDQPRLLVLCPSFDDVDFATLPDRFVIKPDGHHSGHGVHLLTRVGDGRFLDQFRGEEVTVEFLRAEYAQLRARLKTPDRYGVIVEEWVSGERGFAGAVPLDYKVYAFYGRPKLILQVNRNIKPTGLGWFDGNFRPLRIGDCFVAIPDIYQLDSLLLPRCWKDLLRVARRMTLAMRVPFSRIDLFGSDRGPLLGEITLTPGGAGYSYPFTNAFDRKLGMAWERAARRIARDAAATGRGPVSRGRAKEGGGRRSKRRATAPSGGARTRTP